MRRKRVKAMRYPDFESSVLEFKRELPKSDQIVKTMIGFCNQNGGKLVVGVSDSGDIEGIPPADQEKLLESIEKAIFEATQPSIIPRVSLRRFGDKTVVEIEVSSGMNKPYYRKSEGRDRGTYIRLGSSTLRATSELIKELEWQSSGLSFETMPEYKSTKNELDLKRVQNFLKNKKIGVNAPVSDELLKSYGLIIEEHFNYYPTKAGLLLFGKNPQKYLSEAIIICTHFQGNSGREVLASVDCEGDLFNQIHQAESFVVGRMTRAFNIKKTKRDEILEIPYLAIREALINAVVHRNYHIQAPIKIAIFENRIEIFSPGQFPGPLNTKNLRSGITYLRNPAICKVLREAGYVEKLGSGLITIFEEYEKQNLEDPVIVEGENYIKCVLPRLKKLNVSKNDTEVIFSLLQTYSEITLDQIQQTLKVSRATATRKINQLIEKGYVIRVGKTRAIRYKRS